MSKPYPLEKDKPKSRCRVWRITVANGKDPKTGKYKQVTKTFHGSYRDAEAAQKELEQEIKNRRHIRGKTTFEGYRELWIAKRWALTNDDLPDDKRIARATVLKNEDCMKCASMHLDPYKLSDITPSLIEEMYISLMSGQSPSGRRLSGTYVSDIATMLRHIFKDAVRDGEMPSNPCDFVKPPSKDTEEKKALEIKDMRRLIDKLDPKDPSQLVILLCVKLGLRRGEAHGLSWGDIDGDIIHVTHNFDKTGRLKETKTKKGKRILPLTPSARKDLQERRKKMEEDFCDMRNKTGSKHPQITADTPIICNKIGERYHPDVSTRWWGRNRKRLGFEDVTIHEMRHSYLSEMVRRGTDPKVLQELAGHAQFSTTMNIYAHVNLEDKKKAAAVVDW